MHLLDWKWGAKAPPLCSTFRLAETIKAQEYRGDGQEHRANAHDLGAKAQEPGAKAYDLGAQVQEPEAQARERAGGVNTCMFPWFWRQKENSVVQWT